MDRINKNKKVKATLIINNGINSVNSMLEDDNLLTLAGWCNVFHHSTEYLIIGRFIDPSKIKTDEIFSPTSILLKDLFRTIIII